MCFFMAPAVAMMAAQTATQAMSLAQQNSEAKHQAKGLARAADRARSEANERADSDREKAERMRAALRTGYARAGVVAEGSPGEALTSLAADQESEIQRQLKSSYGQADDLDNQANLVRAKARYSLLNNIYGMGQNVGQSVAGNLMR